MLGLWVGEDGEGAKCWMSVLAEQQLRGIDDVLVVCCDGLAGLPEAINATWPKATVQTCVVHLMRASLRYASKKDHPKLTPALRAIDTPPTEQAAEAALEEFEASELGRRYPAIQADLACLWNEVTPFLAFPPQIRKVISSTNLIESINARLGKVTRNRGYFPREHAAIKTFYPAIRHLIEPKGGNPDHVAPGWKAALNAFSISFEDRIRIS